jgi:hypothetical protein
MVRRRAQSQSGLSYDNFLTGMPRILKLINFQASEHKPDGHLGEQQIWLFLARKTDTR